MLQGSPVGASLCFRGDETKEKCTSCCVVVVAIVDIVVFDPRLALLSGLES